MTDIKDKPKLTIEIPEINLENLDKKIFDGIPSIKKGINKNLYSFSDDLFNNERPIKKLKINSQCNHEIK